MPQSNNNVPKKKPLKPRIPKNLLKSCVKKKAYESSLDAYSFLQQMHKHTWRRWNCYRCIYCDKYHVTYSRR